MPDRAAWIAFLLMCFAVVGMTGMFASYVTVVPVERALIRTAALDRVLAAERGPDPGTALEALRPALGPRAATVLSGPGDLWDRVATERALVLEEQRRDANSVAFRVRMMIGVVTLMAALIGAGIMAMALRNRDGTRGGPRVLAPAIAKGSIP